MRKKERKHFNYIKTIIEIYIVYISFSTCKKKALNKLKITIFLIVFVFLFVNFLKQYIYQTIILLYIQFIWNFLTRITMILFLFLILTISIFPFIHCVDFDAEEFERVQIFLNSIGNCCVFCIVWIYFFSVFFFFCFTKGCFSSPNCSTKQITISDCTTDGAIACRSGFVTRLYIFFKKKIVFCFYFKKNQKYAFLSNSYFPQENLSGSLPTEIGLFPKLSSL